jgi:phosphoribosylglycinamide formyltransferase
MHIFTTSFLSRLSTAKIPIINLHPLPGEFNGANAIARAHAAPQEGRTKRTGTVIHSVVRGVDRGEPIVARVAEMKEGEGLMGLKERIHVLEHELVARGTRIALARLWKRKGERSKKSLLYPTHLLCS